MLNANTIKTFDLHDFLKQGEVFHYSKVTLFDADDICYHKHNYYEIFWIENGTGEQHINNAKVNLFSGIISFIKKDDIHQWPKFGTSEIIRHTL